MDYITRKSTKWKGEIFECISMNMSELAVIFLVGG
jgi:hypothetical protein